MRRIAILLFSAAFVFGSVDGARAVDVKTYGFFHQGFGWVDNSSFRDITEDDFRATLRLRGWVEFIASEALKGVYAFQVGNLDYGRSDQGAGLDTTGVNVRTRFMYIDWLVPNTDLTFRMGLQDFGLPTATAGNSPVHSGNAAGVVGNYKFNNTVSLTAFWFRPFDNDSWYSQEHNSAHNTYDAMDMFGLVLPLSFDGFTVSPWALYSSIGNASGYWDYRANYTSDFGTGGTPGNFFANSDDQSGSSDWYSGGLAATINLFDPFTIKFDGMYGAISNDDSNGVESSGWWFAALLEYKLDWGTPGILGWYSTGDDADAANNKDFGRIPVLGVDDGVQFTSFGMYGNMPMATGRTALTNTAVGMWGLGLRLWDVSFVKDLKHNFGVYYMQGTNNVENGTMNTRDLAPGGVDNQSLAFMGETVYMTTSDRAWEVDLTSIYKIYENFDVWVELGYINLNMDDAVWGDTFTQDNAWKAQFGFEYKF